LNELSKGTPNAVESSVKGLEDTDTGQRVVTSQLLENWETNEHTLFIDDGTGFTPTVIQLARSNLSGLHGSGSSSLLVDSTVNFPVSGYLLLSPDDSTVAEVIEYSSKNDSANTLALVGTTSNSHADDDEVLLVDVLPLAEEGQNYFQLSDYPVQQNTAEIYHNASGEYLLQELGTDYFLNRTNGQLQFYGSGLPSGTQVVTYHAYYTGLVQLAQKVINGSKENPSTYPGYVAAGIIIHIDTPTIRQITIILSISVDVGYDEGDVREDVRLVVENYIDGLRIGDNVVLAKIISRAMGVDGVTDAKVQYPSSNIVILEEEIPKSFDSSGNSLVTVV
jgi:hypothetical protein